MFTSVVVFFTSTYGSTASAASTDSLASDHVESKSHSFRDEENRNDSLLNPLTMTADQNGNWIDPQREVIDVIIDAGSSGTRVYQFKHRLPFDDNSPCNVTVIDQVDGGLADSHKKDTFVDHLNKLESILVQIKDDIRDDSKIFMYGTAGMRVYTKDDKELDESIWARVQDTLKRVFGREGQVKTLDGRIEGLYSLLSVNFLAAQENNNNSGSSLHLPLGSLDLGGSSSQIALPPLSDNMNEEDLVIKSFTGAGMTDAHNSLSSDQKVLCNFAEDQCKKGEKDQKLCSGSGEDCRNAIEEVLGPTIGIQMNNITKPSATKNGGVTPGNFIAISGFFYIVSFLHHLGELSSFDPTWTQLKESTDRVCQMKTADVKAELLRNPHIYTKITWFPSRCFQANYILKVLEWYNFPKDTRGAVVFKFKINDNEVEWPLGALVYHYRPELKKTFCSSQCQNVNVKNMMVPEIDYSSYSINRNLNKIT